jgi:hypothetical protein
MKKFRFISGDLAGDIFYDQHREPRGSALFLYGFPSFVGPNQLVQDVVAEGYALISPHYYGTYDSSGAHSPASMAQTIRDTDNALSSGRIVKIGSTKSPIPLPPISVAVGHSFGTAALIRSAYELPSLERMLLLAPTMHYGRTPVDYGMRSDGRDGYNGTLASHPLTYRLAPIGEWASIFDGTDKPVLHDLAGQLQTVHVVIGEDDPYFDVPIAADASIPLVKAYVGNVPTTVQVLPSAAPGIDERLSSPAFSISKWLSAA